MQENRANESMQDSRKEKKVLTFFNVNLQWTAALSIIYLLL